MTTAEEIYQANRRPYNAAELAAFDAAQGRLEEGGFDFVTREGLGKNVDLIDNYFQANRSVAVTVSAIYAFMESRKSEFVSISPAKRAYYKIAATNPSQAAALEIIYDTGQNVLVKDGDQRFENLTTLLRGGYFQGREVNGATFSAAIEYNRSSSKFSTHPKGVLYFTQTAHHGDPRSHTHPDRQVTDQAPAPPQNEPYWKKVRREREEREARNNPAPKPEAGPVDAWETISKGLLGGHSHTETEALQQIFDRGVSKELQWREVHTRMQRLKNSYGHLIPTAKF